MGDAQRNRDYSRDEGVATYQTRRRRGRFAKIFVAVALIAIIGGASYVFGKQFIDPDKVPFDLPGVERSSESEEAAPEDAPAPSTFQPAEVSLVAAGDVIVDGVVTESGRQASGAFEFGHLFKPLANELGGFDVRIVEQETALAGSKFGFGATWPLNAPQDLGRAEKEAGFNVVLRATDHTLDTGGEGIHGELQWWRDTFPEMPVLGMADPKPEDNPTLANYVPNVYVYDKDGFKIAILNHSIDVPEENSDMVSRLTEQKIADDVAKAREQGAQMIVACPHWGEENNSTVTAEQKHFAWIYANQGVDVIIGTHPRVLQGTEVLQREDGHKTVCFYSLGCLITSGTDNSLLGGLAEVKLARDDQGTCTVTSASIKPVITHRGNGTDYCTYLFADYTDELTWSSWDGWPGIDEWNSRLREILGSDYDEGSREYHVNLDATTLPGAEETEQQTEEEGQEQQAADDGENAYDDEYWGYGYDDWSTW